MDINNNIRASDEGRDFISDLPDDILVRILSCLPIKNAISTVLLRRFGNLWRRVHVLDLEDNFHSFEDPPDYWRPYHDEAFVDLIRHVLDLHNCSVLDKLCLKYNFSPSFSKGMGYLNVNEIEWEKGASDQLQKLIRYAISKKVKVLDLCLKQYSPVMEPMFCFDLPNVVSSNYYLTHLKLAAFNMMSCTTIDLKSLKVLLLDEVFLSNEIMEKVLGGCPFLEDLSLIDCYGFTVLSCENPNLKKVMVSVTRAYELSQNYGFDSFFMTFPYVSSLEVCGWIHRARILGSPSVVDASISLLHAYSSNFRCRQGKYSYILWLLLRVSKCKTFSPCTSTILVFTILNFTNVHCPSFEWKNLILKLSLTKWHPPGISLLLKKSQSLETLTMHIYPSTSWADEFFEKPEAKWIEAYEFDMDNFWDSQEASFPFLKNIMINGYVNEPYVFEMVMFLLRSATSLQTLVISTKKSFKPNREETQYFRGPIERLESQFTSEQLQELSDKFKSLPRASPDATVYFS